MRLKTLKASVISPCLAAATARAWLTSGGDTTASPGRCRAPTRSWMFTMGWSLETSLGLMMLQVIPKALKHTQKRTKREELLNWLPCKSKFTPFQCFLMNAVYFNELWRLMILAVLGISADHSVFLLAVLQHTHSCFRVIRTYLSLDARRFNERNRSWFCAKHSDPVLAKAVQRAHKTQLKFTSCIRQQKSSLQTCTLILTHLFWLRSPAPNAHTGHSSSPPSGFR